MPAAACVPPQLRNRVFRGTSAIRSGLLTPNQLRGPAWRRLYRDVSAHGDLQVSHALRTRAAALLVVPGAVVTGASAAVLWGVALVEADDDVELTLPAGAPGRKIPGIRIRRAASPAGDIGRQQGVPVTTPLATALRLAGHLPRDDAFVAIDRLLLAGIVDLEQLRSRAASALGRGTARARIACTLADGRAESPQETRLRLLMQRGGLPAPAPQFRVTDGGRFVARVDFAWPERKVAVEYDGLWHAEPEQFARDRRRLNRLQAAGWRVVFVTAADLHDPIRLVARIAAALGLVR